MFKSKKKQINPGTTDTLIGEGTLFEGRIRSEASIRIEGQITGDIDCAGDVIIGEKGDVKSNITARNIILAGSVHGNVITKGKLTITSSGQLHGNITANTFIIDEGGIFQGTSKMEPKPGTAPTASEVETGSKPFNGNGPNSGFNGGNTIAM